MQVLRRLEPLKLELALTRWPKLFGLLSPRHQATLLDNVLTVSHWEEHEPYRFFFEVLPVFKSMPVPCHRKVVTWLHENCRLEFARLYASQMKLEDLPVYLQCHGVLKLTNLTPDAAIFVRLFPVFDYSITPSMAVTIATFFSYQSLLL